MPDIDLLHKVLGLIEEHPNEWKQEHWRCESGMCFAGWTVVATGAQFASNDPSNRGYQMVTTSDGFAEDIEIYAMEALGLSGLQAGRLFDWGNNLDDLRRLVADHEELEMLRNGAPKEAITV